VGTRYRQDQAPREVFGSLLQLLPSVQSRVPETRFYEPLVCMANAILDFSADDSSHESVKPRTPQRYLRNDPKRIQAGVINSLSPDIVAVHEELLAHDGSGEQIHQI
jgi:hypothetical protein